MTPQQLEALVINTMDRARAGASVEDDRIEFKRDWPDTSKARQLAGAANRARGAELIYIIGADENGTLHALSGEDPATWWARTSARFDGVSPDLVRHIIVPLGIGDSVVAMLFETDRAPYVVKTSAGGSPELEVPIRDGTRTRSARRDEILRMVTPELSTPRAEFLNTSITASHFYREDEWDAFTGRLTIFVDQPLTSVFLPLHDIQAALISDQNEFALTMRLDHIDEVAAQFGVQKRPDGVAITGPGSFKCGIYGLIGSAQVEEVRATTSLKLWLSFGVAGSDHRMVLERTLSRDDDWDDWPSGNEEPLAAWK